MADVTEVSLSAAGSSAQLTGLDAGECPLWVNAADGECFITRGLRHTTDNDSVLQPHAYAGSDWRH